MDQDQYDQLFAYLREGIFPSNLSKNKKGSLRRKCKNFPVKDDGLLYFRDEKKYFFAGS